MALSLVPFYYSHYDSLFGDISQLRKLSSQRSSQINACCLSQHTRVTRKRNASLKYCDHG